MTSYRPPPHSSDRRQKASKRSCAKSDARATPEGVSPVTATTLETLESLEGVNGQSGVVTGDTMQRNGLYYRLGDAWHPVEIRQKRTWGCRFKRSANDLILNNGDTYMMFSNVTGSADIKTTANSKGAYAILPAADGWSKNTCSSPVSQT